MSSTSSKAEQPRSRPWAPLERLQNAVSKIKLLLNFDLHVWRLAASLLAGSSSSAPSLRAEDRPGLTAAATDSDSECWYSPRNNCTPPSSLKSGLRRTISPGFSMEDDVDKRAEMFIVNFRRQLQIERQISLDLKYCLDKT
ncbi:hypothetical protein LINGRAHAP2_LOCUS35096 [Linum grandiflorum]